MKPLQGIRQQLRLLAVLPALVILLVMLFLMIWQRFEDARTNMHEMGALLAQHVASGAEFGILSGSNNELRRQANMAMLHPDVKRVVFQNMDRQVLVDVLADVQLNDDELLVFSAPIYRQALLEVPSSRLPERIGQVDVSVSSAPLSGRQRQILLASLLPAVLILLLALAVANGLANSLFKKLNALTKVIKRLGQGDLSAKSVGHYQGELAQLQSDINQLASSLRSAHADQQQAMDSLNLAYQQASRASEAKSDFLAMVGHELRTPLNGVRGMLQLLELTDQTKEQAEYAQAALESSGHLLAVINDILDFSRIDAGSLTLEQVPFALASMLHNSVTTFRYMAQAKGLTFVTQGLDQAAGVQVLGDPTRLRQIINNLLSNAIKFTDAGQVSFAVSLQKKGQDVGLTLAVSDTGIGISASHRGNLFDAFHQVDSSISRRYGGTGLGLAIVQRLADLMSASIDVESEVGRGSTFTLSVTLPTADVNDAEG